jgi:hypothetical protein
VKHQDLLVIIQLIDLVVAAVVAEVAMEKFKDLMVAVGFVVVVGFEEELMVVAGFEALVAFVKTALIH